MRKTLTKITALLVLLMLVLSAVACQRVPAEGLWENATYLSDRSFGSGEKTVKVTVEAGEQSVVFTVKTDEETLDKALLEHDLIAGEEGQFGLTLITVNGIDAVWDEDNAYWAIYVGDKYADTGISGIEVVDGAEYKLAWEKM